jgi:pyrroline-5-carboxylate reductase
MKIAFIGGGNMGEAMLAALIAKRITAARDIIVSDPISSRCQYLADKYEVGTTGDSVAAVTGRDVVILAVKPQTLPAVAETLKNKLAGQFVISILAGVRLQTLKESLNYTAIVRSMPNTPAQIGEGVTVWTATSAITATQKKRAGVILGALGKEYFVDDEKYLDAATAVSGSGPAYVFYFVEAFIEAAVSIGWSQETAKDLALDTVYGAVDLLKQSGTEPAELRRMVTSPGGTTAAAIAKLESGKFKEIMAQAVKAALDRAIELGNPNTPTKS